MPVSVVRARARADDDDTRARATTDTVAMKALNLHCMEKPDEAWPLAKKALTLSLTKEVAKKHSVGEAYCFLFLFHSLLYDTRRYDQRGMSWHSCTNARETTRSRASALAKHLNKTVELSCFDMLCCFFFFCGFGPLLSHRNDIVRATNPIRSVSRSS